MKKKLLITLLVVVSLFCLLAISVSAASLSDFVDVKVTLTDGTETTAYLTKGGSWNGYDGYDRVTLYKSYEDSSQTYDWSTVKIFDMRESQIHTFDGTTLTPTGAYPQTLLGYPANNPVNITHVYYPQGSVIIASNSFNKAKGWDSLEYLWIPKSVQIIANDICSGVTTLEMVEFEAGSQCHTIQDQAFTGCTSLSSINLEDTALVTLGFEGNSTTSSTSGVFRSCTSLTTVKFPETLQALGYNCFYLSALSGKVTLPNSVNHVYPGAFLSTMVETLVFGDGAVEIGHNLVGAYSKPGTNEYLKEIYIPAEATITANSSSPWIRCASPVTFYIVGYEGQDCSTLISALTKAYGSDYMKIITEEDAKTAEQGTYDGVIVLGYNKCEAFYGGVHTEDIDNDCTTDNLCENCKRLETEAISHIIATTAEYPDGYTKAGVKTYGCTNPNCTVVDEDGIKLDPIFTALGYSTSLKGDSISGGYKMNTDAYADFVEAGGSILFGIIIVNPDTIASGVELLNSEGKLNEIKGIQLNIEDTKYSTINCYIYDFTEKTLALELVMTLYVIDAEGNVEYIQANSDYTVSKTIGSKVFESVSLQRILATPQPAILPSSNDENY